MPKHPKKFTENDHCPACMNPEQFAARNGLHKGCTIEHGHTPPCKWAPKAEAPETPQKRPGMVPWPASQLGSGSVPLEQGKASSGLLRELYQRKVIIMWEIIPNSDRFQQVMLTDEGAGRVETILQMQMLRPPGIDPNAFIVVTNPAFSAKLENIPDCYTIEQIIETMKRGPDYTKP